MSHSLGPYRLEPARLLCPWNSQGKNTGVGSHFLLQVIFPIQDSNLGLLHDRRILYHLSHQGSRDPRPVHSPQPDPLNIIPCSENGNLSLPLAQAMASEVVPLFLRHSIFNSIFYPEN